MANQPRLTRVCSACGLEKPLAAFLQISGKLGTNYGTICASCRAIGRAAAQSTSDEDSTTETKDKRIGSKERVDIEQEKTRQAKELKELYIKAAKKREEDAAVKTEEADLKEKAEKEHRKFYIETKQAQGFLAQRKPTEPSSSTERQARQQIESNALENQQRVETQKQEDIIKQELQIVSLDLSIPYVAGQTSQLRFQTDTFLKFKSWIGTSAPLVKTLELLYQKSTPTQTTKNPVFENKSKNPKENIEEYIEKRLENPSSTRRR